MHMRAHMCMQAALQSIMSASDLKALQLLSPQQLALAFQ